MSRWQIGLRPQGDVGWFVIDDEFDTMEEADHMAVSLAVAAFNEAGLLLESAVMVDGKLHHEHHPPRRLTTFN